jgi:hypothetical protein
MNVSYSHKPFIGLQDMFKNYVHLYMYMKDNSAFVRVTYLI